MNFDLTQNQKDFQKKIRDFAQVSLAPYALKADILEKIDAEVWPQLARLNLFGVAVPRSYGGGGLDNISLAIAIEEISRVCASTGVMLSVHNCLNENILLGFGSDYLKDKYLSAMATGKSLSAFALTEDSAGSDIYSMTTKASFDGENYILNGSKLFITSADYADVFLTFAYTDREKGKDGISVFVIEKGFEGFALDKKEHFMGMNATGNCALSFTDCKVPKANLVGNEGGGFKIALKVLNSGRIGIGAQALGIAQGALDEAANFIKETPNKDQIVQAQFAEIYTLVECARLLIYKAAYLKDLDKKDVIKEASMAKYFASEAALKAADAAVSICGICSVDTKHNLQRHYRSAKVTQIYEGTNELQKLTIARKILTE